jgi:hypothetical protein
VSDPLIESPVDYARRKASTLRRRDEGPVGDAVRKHAARLWPGVPASALLGLTASSSGPDEFGPSPDFTRGAFAVERSRVASLVAEAVPYLGRDASDDSERPGHGYMVDIEAQVVSGILGYRRHLAEVRKAVPSLWAHPAAAGSSWELRVAAGAYSSGDARMIAALSAMEHDLVGIAPAERWLCQCEHVASWPSERMGNTARGDIAGKWRVAFMHLRAEQRAESGAAIEDAKPGPPDVETVKWFGLWTLKRPDLVASLTRRAEGR